LTKKASDMAAMVQAEELRIAARLSLPPAPLTSQDCR
jgi:hypothetical protein